MSAFITQNIPYIIHWEVYCNEVKGDVKRPLVYTKDQLMGLWLIRPDGTESHSASYLRSFAENAGGKVEKRHTLRALQNQWISSINKE